MESRITGEEFIETLTPENILYIVEISDLQTIQNLCHTSKAFWQWCQNKDFRRIIQGKVNVLREEATQILLNYIKSVLLDDNIQVELQIHDSSGESWYSFINNSPIGAISYTIMRRNVKFDPRFDKGYMTDMTFEEFILDNIFENSPIHIDYYTDTEPDPNLPQEFINNSGVNYTPPFQLIEGDYNYHVKIIPQEFIKDYIHKH